MDVLKSNKIIRKDSMSKEELAKAYLPAPAESKWYAFWQEQKFFTPAVAADKKPFSVVIPPPNVTGSLHMGHALNNTIQDVIVRRKRMQGFSTLWLPGTDHAGIATQNKVEQQLAKEGKTRQDLGREEFIKKVWQWKEKYGNTIINQLKRLGCSCDWSRERFTMDNGYAKSVRTVFVKLYDDGLIYRGHRLINWCPRCHTALSDIEVEHQDVAGHLWHIRYPLKDTDGYVLIATTRPETMLGDTAVAVNPDDKRYQRLIGKAAVLPIIGRELPIIADSYVDPAFGTGALKITPAHDPNDFELGRRHNLETINILETDGRINANGQEFAGLDRFAARAAVVARLEADGLLEKVEDHEHAVGHCYRCHMIVEPYLSDQWFVKMKPLAGPAVDIVKAGQVEFVPGKWERLYYDWMENIRDWCISRQIWWGHQIPAWYCDDCSEIIVRMEAPDSCPNCGGKNLTQETDVLDTWFSSALWPFATLGWPDETEDLKYFYPTSVLSTARDILYLWIARMITTGMKFLEEVPFHTVIIHPTVLNHEGKRMSKSLGTGVDPLGLIERYGTDATRFGLMIQDTPMQDMKFNEEKLSMSRNFANKIWNASRFVLLNLDEGLSIDKVLPPLSSLANKWIVSRLQRVVQDVDQALDSYNLSQAGMRLYDFFWSEYCDWYLEIAKGELTQAENREATQAVLVNVLDSALKLLHPFMPFITEEIWQKLPLNREGDVEKGISIMVSAWPSADGGLLNDQAERQMVILQGIISAVRTIRSELRVSPAAKVDIIIKTATNEQQRVLIEYQDIINRLAGAQKLTVAGEVAKPGMSAMALFAGAEIFIPLVGLVDIASETARLNKELSGVEKKLSGVEKKLSNPGYLNKAPAEIINKDKTKRQMLLDKKVKLAGRLVMLKG